VRDKIFPQALDDLVVIIPLIGDRGYRRVDIQRIGEPTAVSAIVDPIGVQIGFASRRAWVDPSTSTPPSVVHSPPPG